MLMSQWGWICTDQSCFFGCLTEQNAKEHEENTGHQIKELDLNDA